MQKIYGKIDLCHTFRSNLLSKETVAFANNICGAAVFLYRKYKRRNAERRLSVIY